MTRPFAVVMALLLAAAPARAAEQSFTLKNRTGHPIVAVHVSPTKTTDWKEDIVGRDILKDGGEVVIRFPQRGAACVYDLRAIFQDEQEPTWTGLDLCQSKSVELHHDGGQPTAVAQ